MRNLDDDDILQLYLGAVVGTAHLANELERMELVGEDDSLDEARWIRPFILGLADRMIDRGSA